ncbi:MAG TPA: hypothetical protein VL137_13000 [Polyangiaceae bacterium]|nr:hypothetical protein [Polyangiaceae bacterium]
MLTFRAKVASAAALALLGACKDKPEAKPSPAPVASVQAKVSESKASEAKACCMGLNACKGQGGCAVPESHACAGKNACKGQGGCSMRCPK